MLYIISYDTPSTRRRRRFVRLLVTVATRVQKSVFEAHLESRQLQRLQAALGKLVRGGQDDLRIYAIHGSLQSEIIVLGGNRVTSDGAHAAFGSLAPSHAQAPSPRDGPPAATKRAWRRPAAPGGAR